MPPKPYRWVRPDVMPLFAAVAVGIGAAATITTRKLFAEKSSLFCTRQRMFTPQHLRRERWGKMLLRLLFPFFFDRPPSQSSSSSQDPSVTAWRSKRGHEVKPEEGELYKDSALRRFVHGRKVEMFPDNLMGHKHERARGHAEAG